MNYRCLSIFTLCPHSPEAKTGSVASGSWSFTASGISGSLGATLTGTMGLGVAWLDVNLTEETPWAPANPKTSCSSKLEMSFETRGRGVCVGSVVVGFGLGKKEVRGSGGGLEGGGGGGGGVCRGGREKSGVDWVASSVVSGGVISAGVRRGGMNGGREAGWSRSRSRRANTFTLEVESSSSGSSASVDGSVPKGGRLGLSPGRRNGRKGRLVAASSLAGRRGGRTGGRRGSVRLGTVVENSVVVVEVEGVGVVVVVEVDASGFSVTSSVFRLGSLSPSWSGREEWL